MIKAVFLDMDDTLIVNQVLFDRAEAQLYGYLQNFGILPAEAQSFFNEEDKALFKIYGAMPERLFASFESVLKHFVPGADAEMKSIVRELAEGVFTAVAEVKAGVCEAIEVLAQKYPLYIVTAGATDVQEARVEHLPFKDKISDVFIVENKNENTYETVLDKLGLKPSEAVMVGNSLKSDIIPAVAAGLQAVWIEANDSPLHETKKGFPEKNAHKFSSLLEMAHQLDKFGLKPTIPASYRSAGSRRPYTRARAV